MAGEDLSLAAGPGAISRVAVKDRARIRRALADPPMIEPLVIVEGRFENELYPAGTSGLAVAKGAVEHAPSAQ
jgi:hypothetical protein